MTFYDITCWWASYAILDQRYNIGYTFANKANGMPFVSAYCLSFTEGSRDLYIV